MEMIRPAMQPTKPKRGLALTGIFVGSLLTLAPIFIGLIGSLIGMMGAFETLGKGGIADPQALSTHIAHVLFSTMAGLVLFPVGIVTLVVSIIFYVRRPPLAPPPLP